MGTTEQCLIFDNDGTLVDSEFVQQQAMADELAELSIAESAERLSVTHRGWNLADQLDHISQTHGVAIDDGFIGRFRIRLSDYLSQRLQPSEGVKEALELVPQPKCVASNAPVEKVSLCLEVTGLTDFFGGNIFSAYDVGVWKPEPDLFLAAAEAMGFAPAQCVVIEDSEVGLQAAEAAGMAAVFYNPLELKIHHGDTVVEIKTMTELASAISRTGGA